MCALLRAETVIGCRRERTAVSRVETTGLARHEEGVHIRSLESPRLYFCRRTVSLASVLPFVVAGPSQVDQTSPPNILSRLSIDPRTLALWSPDRSLYNDELFWTTMTVRGVNMPVLYQYNKEKVMIL